MDDHTVMMYGKKFNIVGTHTSIGFVVPFLSVPAETPMNTIGISFENNINRKTYDILKNTADEVIPNKLKFPDLNFPDSETIYIYNNVMVISVLIAALTIINFAFLYNFIFNKRKRQLAIMRICGCTSIRAWAICLGECFAVCVPVFLIGILTYIPFMHGVLADVFEYMDGSYTPTIYAAIFIIYIVMLLVIMGIMLSSQVNKTLAESRKKEVG